MNLHYEQGLTKIYSWDCGAIYCGDAIKSYSNFKSPNYIYERINSNNFDISDYNFYVSFYNFENINFNHISNIMNKSFIGIILFEFKDYELNRAHDELEEKCIMFDGKYNYLVDKSDLKTYTYTTMPENFIQVLHQNKL